MKLIENHKFLYKTRIFFGDFNSENVYQSVALFMDKPRFICWVHTERNKLRIRKYRPLDEPRWYYQHYKAYTPMHPKYQELVKDAEKIASQLKMPLIMTNLITQAVAFGVVKDKRPLIRQVNPSYHTETTEYAIFPNLTTTKQEILEALKYIKKEYRGMGKLMGIDQTNRNKRPRFNDFREWYWLRMRGDSSKDIAKTESNNKKIEVSPEEVEDGIKTYRQWLKE